MEEISCVEFSVASFHRLVDSIWILYYTLAHVLQQAESISSSFHLPFPVSSFLSTFSFISLLFMLFFFFELFGTESFSISSTFLFFMTSSLYQVFHWWSLSKSTWLDIFLFSYCLSVLLSSSGQEICLPYFMLCKTPCALMTPINNKS